MKFFKPSELEIFWPFYLALFFGISVPCIYYIQTLFFLSRGVSITELGFAFGIMFLFAMVAELFTGAYADIFGKKRSMQLMWSIHGITSILMIFVYETWLFYLLFAIQGVSHTFGTGAFEALIYDICKKNKRKNLVNEVYAKVSFIVNMGHIVASGGTFIYLYFIDAYSKISLFGLEFLGMDFLWVSMGIGYFIALVIFSGVEEKVKVKRQSLRKHAIDNIRQVKKGILFSRKNRCLKMLFVSNFFLVASFVMFGETVYQKFLYDAGFGAQGISLIIVFASIFGAIYSLIPKAVSHRFNSEKHFIEFTIYIQLVLLVLLFFFKDNYLFMIFFFLVYWKIHRFLRGPIYDPFKQSFIKDSVRATVGSVDSLLGSIATVLIYFLSGYLVDLIGAANTTLFAFIPLLIGLYFLYRINIDSNGNKI